MASFFESNSTKPSLCVKPEVITLTDCLACSGCITPAESADFFSSLDFLEDKTTQFSFIISFHSKMNLKSFYPEISFVNFEKNLVKFLKETFNISMIVDTSYFKKDQLAGISSECPAVVLYIERIYPNLIGKLSTSKTYQQMAATFISESNSNEDHKIISVMQCYDKKDEGKRDKTKIDHFIGTKDLYKHIKSSFNPIDNLDYELKPWEKSYDQKVDEISGLANCINIFNKAKLQDVGNVELRICEGGCLSGPAQIANAQYDTVLIKNDESLFESTYDPRVFIKPKKRTFKVEW